jgi:hypothetical protein
MLGVVVVLGVLVGVIVILGVIDGVVVGVCVGVLDIVIEGVIEGVALIDIDGVIVGVVVIDGVIVGVGDGEAQTTHASTATPKYSPANSDGKLNNCTWNFLELDPCLNQKKLPIPIVLNILLLVFLTNEVSHKLVSLLLPNIQVYPGNSPLVQASSALV